MRRVLTDDARRGQDVTDGRQPVAGRPLEEHRPRLRAVAYRMLGPLAEAEDTVQDAWLCLGRSEVGGGRRPRPPVDHHPRPHLPEPAAHAEGPARGAPGRALARSCDQLGRGAPARGRGAAGRPDRTRPPRRAGCPDPGRAAGVRPPRCVPAALRGDPHRRGSDPGDEAAGQPGAAAGEGGRPADPRPRSLPPARGRRGSLCRGPPGRPRRAGRAPRSRSCALARLRRPEAVGPLRDPGRDRRRRPGAPRSRRRRRGPGEIGTAVEHAIWIAREFGDSDGELLGLAYGGLALVSTGRVPQGLEWVDEAVAAATGEPDHRGRGTGLLRRPLGCGRASDLSRAAQWS
ncbi:MAG TPA: sigma factor [Candidatus Dormibacteraeota bacterium]|nr:sigma factor [Candidatus Dormibacteraeota bacterium]